MFVHWTVLFLFIHFPFDVPLPVSDSERDPVNDGKNITNTSMFTAKKYQQNSMYKITAMLHDFLMTLISAIQVVDLKKGKAGKYIV